MMKIIQTKYITVEISKDEAKAITIEYLSNIIIGEGCRVTKENHIKHWTSWPHGSGTTTDKGEATELQKNTANVLRHLRQTENNNESL